MQMLKTRLEDYARHAVAITKPVDAVASSSAVSTSFVSVTTTLVSPESLPLSPPISGIAALAAAAAALPSLVSAPTAPPQLPAPSVSTMGTLLPPILFPTAPVLALHRATSVNAITSDAGEGGADDVDMEGVDFPDPETERPVSVDAESPPRRDIWDMGRYHAGNYRFTTLLRVVGEVQHTPTRFVSPDAAATGPYFPSGTVGILSFVAGSDA
jgi:hypothetical protein